MEINQQEDSKKDIKTDKEKIIDEQLSKWKGTGLEDEIYNEYMDPMTRKRNTNQDKNIKKKEPLFQKSSIG